MKRNGITYTQGNLFDAIHPQMDCEGKVVIVPHIVNDIGVMGSGFVVPLCNHWPVVKKNYLAWANHGFGVFALGEIQAVNCKLTGPGSVYVVNMVAQHQTIRENPKPIRYGSLCQCMESVSGFASKHSGVEFHCPMFGSDLAQGKWEFIEELILEFWISKSIPVHIHVLDEKVFQKLDSKGSE